MADDSIKYLLPGLILTALGVVFLILNFSGVYPTPFYLDGVLIIFGVPLLVAYELSK